MTQPSDISRHMTVAMFDTSGVAKVVATGFEHEIQADLPEGWTYAEWRLSWTSLDTVPNYNDLTFVVLED